MRFVELIALLVGAILVQLLGSHLIPSFNLAVDAFLVVAVLFALEGGLAAGMIGGLVAGMAADALSGGLFGLHGFADTIVGYGTAVAAHRLVIRRPSSVLLVAAVAAIVQQVVLLTLRRVLVDSAPMVTVGWTVVQVVTTGLLTVVVYILLGRLQRRLAVRRERRGSRIRFGR